MAGGADARALADELDAEGAEVLAVVSHDAPARAITDATADPATAALLATLSKADLLVVNASRDGLTAALVAACDRFGVRVVARCGRPAEHRAAARFGIRAVAADAPARDILDSAAPASSGAPAHRGRLIAVWGPAGAPGRSTLAIALASELARDGRHVALVDADSHAPSLALLTGLPDEGPGFAAACRQAARGSLTPEELSRIALPLGDVSVLPGINRPSRWPELAADRVHRALAMCREWADDVVVDVAASLETDEEIVSDLDGPRRNAATLATLRAADLVIAVFSADPVGVSRFVRSHPELRAATEAPIRAVANRTRTRVLGLDPRGQVRRTLERYAGVRDVWFLPFDPRAVDVAMLTAQPVLQAAGRSALTAAVRRFVGESIEVAAPVVTESRRRRHSRSRRRAAAPAGR